MKETVKHQAGTFTGIPRGDFEAFEKLKAGLEKLGYNVQFSAEEAIEAARKGKKDEER
ncbi:MAG: hypothetical protein LBK27_05600 [Treponema sp.]|jgi:hypothetical protein|nr:hypothetical protein [Treponema sp.]